MVKKGTIRKPKIKCICQKCGKEFFRWPSQFIGGRTKFCSSFCKLSATTANRNRTVLIGERHPRYKGYKKQHNRSGGTKEKIIQCRIAPGVYRPEHTLIAMKILGRPLKRSECVHHIDGDGTNNEHKNLLICSGAYHTWLHQKMSKLYQEEHFGKKSKFAPRPCNEDEKHALNSGKPLRERGNPEPSLSFQEGVEHIQGVSLKDKEMCQTTNAICGNENYSGKDPRLFYLGQT